MSDKSVTLVTGLWDLGRGDMDGWASRKFEDYKNNFFSLLEIDVSMCVFIPKSLEADVRRIRGDRPTEIYFKEIKEFSTWNPFFDKIQDIRSDWLSAFNKKHSIIQKIKNRLSGYTLPDWLEESPQCALEYYNAMMFTKMFMLHDSVVNNPFNSQYFYWIDGGLTSTVSIDLLKQACNEKLADFNKKQDDKFMFITYPYTSNTEIHGMNRKSMSSYCGVEFVDKVARGGFFGGPKEMVVDINAEYYNILESTLSNNEMGADECLFTILTYKFPDLIYNFTVRGNGLIDVFFQHVIDSQSPDNKDLIEIIQEVVRAELMLHSTTPSEVEDELIESVVDNINNVGLYIITFNSPAQLEALICSMEACDDSFLNTPTIHLLDNSTDISTEEEYVRLCSKYNINRHKKDNIGICGGRQWVAEHAEESEYDFYFFFEDDMMLNNETKKSETCSAGFSKYVPNLYSKSLDIARDNQLDFLKLSYTEFFGDNSTQWAWYNVPQDIREKRWPDYCKLPEIGVDLNAPKTKFNNIVSYKGAAYADGEVYYCNWPQVVSREGNQKMFLATKWEHPHEQTWMSYIYQQTRDDDIKSAVLLLSPITHDRFEHYESGLRKES